MKEGDMDTGPVYYPTNIKAFLVQLVYYPSESRSLWRSPFFVITVRDIWRIVPADPNVSYLRRYLVNELTHWISPEASSYLLQRIAKREFDYHLIFKDEFEQYPKNYPLIKVDAGRRGPKSKLTLF